MNFDATNWAAAEEIAEQALQAATLACRTTDANNNQVKAGNHLSRAFHILTLQAVQLKTGDPYLTEHDAEVREAADRIWTQAWERVHLALV